MLSWASIQAIFATMQARIALVFLILYAVSLHVSMAAMELFSSLLVVCGLVALITRKVKFRTELQVPIFLYCGFMAFNTLVTPNAVPWIERIGELRWVFVYWALVKVLEIVWSSESEKKILWGWVIGLSAATAFGVFQFFTGMDPIRSSTSHLVPTAGDVFRATGFFSLCLTFSYSMGISGFSLSMPARRLSRWAPVLVLGISGVAVITSMTRGSWLAFGIAGLFMIIAYRKFFKTSQLVALLSFAAVGIISLMTTAGGADRINRLINYNNDESFQQRISLWKTYYQMFVDHPVLGIGYRQGSAFVGDYYQKLNFPAGLISHAHNDYLQALAETGIAGLLVFIFLIAYTMKKTWELRLRRPEWAYALLTGQIYIFLGSLSQANFTDAEVNHFVMFNWALASFLLAATNGGRDFKTPPLNTKLP